MKFIMYVMDKNKINDWHTCLLIFFPISAFSLSPCEFGSTALVFVQVIKEHRHYVNSFSEEMKWKK